MLRSLAGGTLFGEVWGSDPPEVLALHGWRRTHADFAASVGPAARAGALPVLAPDLPGFGSTPAPAAGWGSADYAEALVALLEEAGATTNPVVVLGHSLGGRIAVVLAAGRPDLVRALVLTGAPVAPRSGRASKVAAPFRLARTLHRLGILSGARMEEARRRYGSADYRAADGVLRDILVRMVNETYETELAAISCPVDLVWGDDDREVPPAVARAVVERIPAATLTLLPGAGHLTPLSAPDELRAVVDRALERSR